MVIRIYTKLSIEKSMPHSLKTRDLLIQLLFGNGRLSPGVRVIDEGFNSEQGLLFLLLV